jgi:DNA-binding transcriptional LysR family regulator
MIDWDDYRYFLAVAEAGSLSAAARRLGVTQPTMGRRIKELEARLQARLFERLNQGYVLTTAGERIRELAEAMEQRAMAIETRVGGEDAELSGRVRVSTAEGLGIFWLGPKLPALRQRYPGIDPELIIGMTLVDMLRREADLVLRVGNPGSEELVGRRVAVASCGLFAAESYLRSRPAPKTLDDLRQHTIIESERGIAELAQTRLLREMSQGATIGLRCNNIMTQIAAARAGLGLLALPGYMTAGAPELRRLLPDAFNLKIDIWLLTHRDLRNTARVRAIRDFLAEEIRKDQEWFKGTSKN